VSGRYPSFFTVSCPFVVEEPEEERRAVRFVEVEHGPRHVLERLDPRRHFGGLALVRLRPRGEPLSREPPRRGAVPLADDVPRDGEEPRPR